MQTFLFHPNTPFSHSLYTPFKVCYVFPIPFPPGIIFYWQLDLLNLIIDAQAYLLNQLKILTLNCQGLRNKSKCRDVFNNLKQKNHNVYFLQDTHLTPIEENQIQTLWGYKTYFNSYASNSRGVGILFNNNCEIEIHNQYKDDSGNFLILDVTINSLRLLLINMHGPNTDVP